MADWTAADWAWAAASIPGLLIVLFGPWPLHLAGRVLTWLAREADGG